MPEDLFQRVKNLFLAEINKVSSFSKDFKEVYSYLIRQSCPELIQSNRFYMPYKEGSFIVGYLFKGQINRISLILSKKENEEIKKALYLELEPNEKGVFNILAEELLESRDSREMRQKFDDKLTPLKQLDALKEEIKI